MTLRAGVDLCSSWKIGDAWTFVRQMCNAMRSSGRQRNCCVLMGGIFAFYPEILVSGTWDGTKEIFCEMGVGAFGSAWTAKIGCPDPN